MVHFTRACKTLLSENNKTRLTFEKQQEKNKNIICRPWSVRIEKNCARGLEYGPRPQASGRAQDRGPPGRQIIYINLGAVCYVAKTDIKYSFRIIPVQALDYPLLGIK